MLHVLCFMPFSFICFFSFFLCFCAVVSYATGRAIVSSGPALTRDPRPAHASRDSDARHNKNLDYCLL
jgi:hypothetical protein